MLAFLLRSFSPVSVVYCRVLEKCSEDEHEAHHQVDVNGFNVGDPWQRASHASADRRHRQHSRYTLKVRSVGTFRCILNFHGAYLTPLSRSSPRD